MTIANRYPPKIYLFMLNIATKNQIPLKRVEIVLLQKGVQELGFTCDHLRMGIRPSDTKPFCKDCWTIFRQKKAPKYSYEGNLNEPGQYVREPTFLDKDKGEHTDKNEEKEQELKLTGPPRKYSPRIKSANLPHGED